MKTRILALCLLWTMTASAQKKLSVYAGLGIGGTLGERQTVPGCGVKKGSPYIAGQISGYYRISRMWQPGLKLIMAGELIPTSGCNYYDVATNTMIVDGNRLPASSILLCNRFSLPEGKTFRPFIDLGLGITHFSYRSVTADVQEAGKTSFAISPEIGVDVDRLTLSTVFVFGGNTASFSGFDSFSNNQVRLESTRAQQLYFMAAYRLFQF